MPHKKRKVRKKRGSRTHGYGQVGQHRGGGQRGGHGKAGLKKHKWTYTVKYDPERFGKHGFKPPTKREVSAINVGELDEQIDSLLDSKQAEKTKDGVQINLNRLGYDKLLRKGRVAHPLIIQVKSCSKSAAEKIEETGIRENILCSLFFISGLSNSISSPFFGYSKNKRKFYSLPNRVT